MWPNTNECNTEFLRTPISATSITPVLPSGFTRLREMQHRAGSCLRCFSLSCSSPLPTAVNQQSRCQVRRAVGPNPAQSFCKRTFSHTVNLISVVPALEQQEKSEMPAPVYWYPLAQGILERFSHLDLLCTKKTSSHFLLSPKRIS